MLKYVVASAVGLLGLSDYTDSAPLRSSDQDAHCPDKPKHGHMDHSHWCCVFTGLMVAGFIVMGSYLSSNPPISLSPCKFIFASVTGTALSILVQKAIGWGCNALFDTHDMHHVHKRSLTETESTASPFTETTETTALSLLPTEDSGSGEEEAIEGSSSDISEESGSGESNYTVLTHETE